MARKYFSPKKKNADSLEREKGPSYKTHCLEKMLKSRKIEKEGKKEYDGGTP